MNPYIFDPKKIETVEPARYVVGLFDSELATDRETIVASEKILGATLDALIQAHPEAEASLNSLVYAGKLVGHAEHELQKDAEMKAQFISALPYKVKQQLV